MISNICPGCHKPLERASVLYRRRLAAPTVIWSKPMMALGCIDCDAISLPPHLRAEPEDTSIKEVQP